jgi:ribosomal protein S18 acetylase RimI-like enzyme
MTTSLIDVRPLCPADIEPLIGVLARAYASQQNFVARLNAYLAMRAVATFVAELDGEPVGMVVGNDYGSSAYLAQMAVDPPLHRRGIGTALMDALMNWAEMRGFESIELDATPMGAPLYARYGFVTTSDTLVYHAPTQDGDRFHPAGVRSLAAGDRGALFAADKRAFGADRSDVLRLLLDANHTSVVVSGASGAVDGFAIAQPRVELLGPVIAADAECAGALVDAARAMLPAAHRLSVPSDNPAALALVAARGYRHARSLEHMVRGAPPPGKRRNLYARINLGQG